MAEVDVAKLQAQLALLQEQAAADRASAAALGDAADVFWAFFGAVLVFFMQCGFTLLEAGSVRSKTTQNILIKNLVDACLGGVLWYSVGYALAYGGGEAGNPFIGTTWDALTGAGANWSFWMLSWAYAATAATIVSGAVAERCEFLAYLCYTTVMTTIVVVHWAWHSSGWLFQLGYHDFGGSGVVHMLGGGAALMGSVFIGPRLGRFAVGPDGKWYTKKIRGHSTTLCAMGVFIMWFGWYGFNPAATHEFLAMRTAARAAVATTLSACCGGLCALLIDVLHGHMPSVHPIINGILAGLVAVTASCACVEPFAAAGIGMVAAAIYYFASKMLKRLKIDDPLDACPVHLFCGAWGVVSVGLFATEEYMAELRPVAEGETQDYADFVGVFCGGNGRQLGAQLAGLAAIAAWTLSTCAILFGALSYFKKLRVPADHEWLGLDKAHHGGPAYNMSEDDQVSSFTLFPVKINAVAPFISGPAPQYPPSSAEISTAGNVAKPGA